MHGVLPASVLPPCSLLIHPPRSTCMKPIHRTLRRLLAIAGLLACALPAGAAAQDTDTTAAAGDSIREVRLVDGTVLYGRVREQGGTVTVWTEEGATLHLRSGEVFSITTPRVRVVRGRAWPADPNASRLFFVPTARAVGAGNGSVGVYEIFVPFITYGVTSRISISGGAALVPDVIGRVYYLAPKVTLVQGEQVSAAAGVVYGRERDDGITIAYGVGTFGGEDRALTVGAGWGISDFDSTDGLIFMAGGEARVGRGAKFISENYLVPGVTGALTSAGVRFFNERLSADLGLATQFGQDDCGGGCFVPVVNFVYSF